MNENYGYGEVPDWVNVNEELMGNDSHENDAKSSDVTIKFGKGLVGKPFTNKNGKELVEVKIPNANPDDKSPWKSFTISPKMIHDNKFGKGVWMKLPADGKIRIGTPHFEGKNEAGKNIWKKEFSEISNKELKSLMESYKTHERTSVIGGLEKNGQEVSMRTSNTVKRNNKSQGMDL